MQEAIWSCACIRNLVLDRGNYPTEICATKRLTVPVHNASFIPLSPFHWSHTKPWMTVEVIQWRVLTSTAYIKKKIYANWHFLQKRITIWISFIQCFVIFVPFVKKILLLIRRDEDTLQSVHYYVTVSWIYFKSPTLPLEAVLTFAPWSKKFKTSQ